MDLWSLAEYTFPGWDLIMFQMSGEEAIEAEVETERTHASTVLIANN